MIKYQDAEQIIEAAAEILPIVRDGADASEASARICEPVLKALFERRLFRLWIPREFDGEEADLVTALRVFELLSSADGATGWVVMIGAGAGLFAGFLEPLAAAEIFGAESVVVAGSGAVTGVARKGEMGYRVTGRWCYVSGAHHATWFTANCVVEDPTGAESGDRPLAVRSVAVPATDVQLHETWSVSAMQGTGSVDFEIADRFVPFAHTFSALDDAPRVSGPLYRVPFYSIAALSFASVSLGIARHALDEFKALAVSKRPMGSDRRLADDPDVQARMARAEAAVGSARSHVYDLAARAWETVSRGDPVSTGDRTRIQLAAIDATRQCAVAVDLLYERAGMTPLFSSSVLGRAWRDAHAVTQNAVVSAGLYVDAGRTLLGE